MVQDNSTSKMAIQNCRVQQRNLKTQTERMNDNDDTA